MVRGRTSKNPRSSSDWNIAGHIDDWAELAVDYVDDRLDLAAKNAIQAHLVDCPSCAARLEAQRRAVSLFAQDALAQVPADLESMILGRVLKEPEAATRLFSRRRSAQDTSRRRSVLSPAGPWLPALAGAAAVVVLVLALTISRGSDVLDGTITTAAVFTADEGSGSTVRDASAVQTSSTSQVLLASGEDTDGGGQTDDTTTATEDGVVLAALRPAGPLLQDEAAMTNGLAEADSTAYFFFDTADGSLVTAAQADTIASRLTSTTGLSLVNASLSSGIRAFAAFVPRDDSEAVVSLLSSVGRSQGLNVCLSLSPGSDVTSWAQSTLKDKYGLAELSADPSPESGWNYTTSTATPTTLGTATTAKVASLDEVGTHVLVVIFMAVQD